MLQRLFIGILAALTPSAGQVAAPTTVPACQAIHVSLEMSTPQLKAGSRPQFSVRVVNNTRRSVRVLNVRDGRRPDLQDAYFELFVLKDGRVVDLPIVISDPGPISRDDYVTLRPRERIDVRPLSYTRAAEKLPPGKYSAFVLFWRDPLAYTSRCRSSEARFVVF